MVAIVQAAANEGHGSGDGGATGTQSAHTHQLPTAANASPARETEVQHVYSRCFYKKKIIVNIYRRGMNLTGTN